MMKMVMTVISRDQADRALDKLISAGYGATFTGSRGGMLRQAQQMIFIATDADKVEDVLKIIRSTCRTEVQVSEQSAETPAGSEEGAAKTTTEVGSAVVFVWDLEHFDTY